MWGLMLPASQSARTARNSSGRVVDGAVIDGVRAALGPQHLVLAGRCRAEDHQPFNGAAQLQHRRPDPAGRHMYQHPLTRTDARDTEQHVVSSEVIDRERSGLLEAHLVRDLEHLPGRHAHHIRVSPEMRQGNHALAHRMVRDAIAQRVNHPRCLISDHGAILDSEAAGLRRLLRRWQAG